MGPLHPQPNRTLPLPNGPHARSALPCPAGQGNPGFSVRRCAAAALCPLRRFARAADGPPRPPRALARPCSALARLFPPALKRSRQIALAAFVVASHTRQRGKVFVDFPSDAAARQARLRLAAVDFLGKPIVAEFARPPPPPPPAPPGPRFAALRRSTPCPRLTSHSARPVPRPPPSRPPALPSVSFPGLSRPPRPPRPPASHRPPPPASGLAAVPGASPSPGAAQPGQWHVHLRARGGQGCGA